MKRDIVLLLLLIFTFSLFGNNYSMELTCTQPVLNILKANYFDPSEPYSQPNLFNLAIRNPNKAFNDSNTELSYALNVEFFWNSNFLTDVVLKPKGVATVYGQQIRVTNREVISNLHNNYFKVEGSFSFDDIIDNSTQLKDFVIDTGRFPDGAYRISMELIPDNPIYQGTSASVTFTVRGIQNVRLISPGVQAGSTNIPKLNQPIIFNWSSSGINNSYVVEIKEFDEAHELNPSNIEYSGRVVVEEDVTNRSVYVSDYNFQPNMYYAWRAKVRYMGEESLNLDNHQQFKASNYFVFKFSSEPTTEISNPFLDELHQTLLNLNIPEITSLFEEGYLPKYSIELNGRVFYGREAIDKLRELFTIYNIEVSVE